MSKENINIRQISNYNREEYKRFRELTSDEKFNADIPETVDRTFEITKFGGLTVEDGEFKVLGKNGESASISNFKMVYLYKIHNENTNEITYLAKLKNSDNGNYGIIEIGTQETASVTDFKKTLRIVDGTFKGNSNNLEDINRRLFLMCVNAKKITDIGYDVEKSRFVLTNGYYDITTRKLKTPDNAGIIKDGEIYYYIPFCNETILKNEKDYSNEIKGYYYNEKSKITTSELLNLMFTAGGYNAYITLLFTIGAVFFDINQIVMNQHTPYLFLYGAKHSGKSEIIKQCLSIFGDGEFSLGTGNITQKYIERKLSSGQNIPKYLNEWDSKKSYDVGAILKTAYDGTLGGNAEKTTGNETNTRKLKGAIIADGNTKPVEDDAVYERGIYLTFRKETKTKEQLKAIGVLQEKKKETFSNVLIELLEKRETYKDNIENLYSEAINSIKTREHATRFEETHSLILAISDVLGKMGINTPVPRTDLVNFLKETINKQNKEIDEMDAVKVFWDSVSMALKGSYSLNNSYTYKSSENKFCIKFSAFYIYYSTYCKNNNIPAYPKQVLKDKLKDSESFIAEQVQTYIKIDLGDNSKTINTRLEHFKATRNGSDIDVEGVTVLTLPE